MTDLEQKLLVWLEEERAKVNLLEQLLFERLGLIEKDQLISVDGKKAIGRLPWNRQRELLESRFRKNEGSEPLRNDSSHHRDGEEGETFGEADDKQTQEIRLQPQQNEKE